MSLNLLLKGQLRMLNEHYEVVAVSSPGEDLDTVAEREGVRTIALPMERHISPLRDLKALIMLIRLFRKERPWMVHSLTPKAGLLAMMASWLCRVPVRMHTFTGLVFPTATGLKQKILILTDKITCWCATYINPEGQGVKRDMERFHITSKPLHIIGNGNVNGIDVDYFNRTDEVIEKAQAYKKLDTFTFCFVGRVVGDKGINELVSAMKLLHSVYPQIRLMLVGPYEDKLDPVSAETKTAIESESYIEFMGWQDDIRPFLAASDVFVFPSYREGFPNVLLQAGAMGLPAIVTDINGSNEIIIEGQNGVIIPPRDEQQLYNAMEHFITDVEGLRKMSANARKYIVERYEQKRLWSEILRVYKSFE